MENPRDQRHSLNVICLHGALKSKDVFDPLIGRIRENNPPWLGDIFALDFPGHGSAQDVRSSYHAKVLATYVLDSTPPDILRKPTIVVAQSFSGITATALANLNPNVVGVVMLDPPLRVERALPAIALLQKKYYEDPKGNEWISRFLSDFFFYEVETSKLILKNYYDEIENSRVNTIIISGNETVFKCHVKSSSIRSNESGSDPDPWENKTIVGDYKDVIAYAKKESFIITRSRAGAFFDVEDWREIKRRNIRHVKAFSIPETGHNILVEKNLKIVANIIGILATGQTVGLRDNEE